MKDKNKKTIKLGDHVEVPEPIASDIHQHSFVGSVKGFSKSFVWVEDQEEDAWYIEPERLEIQK
jgi:hypothetical protein